MRSLWIRGLRALPLAEVQGRWPLAGARARSAQWFHPQDCPTPASSVGPESQPPLGRWSLQGLVSLPVCPLVPSSVPSLTHLPSTEKTRRRDCACPSGEPRRRPAQRCDEGLRPHRGVCETREGVGHSPHTWAPGRTCQATVASPLPWALVRAACASGPGHSSVHSSVHRPRGHFPPSTSGA